MPSKGCCGNLIHTISITEREAAPTLPISTFIRRPACLFAVIPKPVVYFCAGAVAGAVGKTMVAPLDRVKILLQVKGGLQRGAVREAAVQGGIMRSLWAILESEGIQGFWKGNLPQLLRVVPYSAVQLGSYELFKRTLTNENGELSVPKRLLAGAMAGMFSTLVTYPLDSLRFRLAVDPDVRTIGQATRVLMDEGGFIAFFRGLKPALLGIAPYMALELGTYDTLPKSIPSFVRGFCAALFASTFCYPMDTVRRRGQLYIGERVSYRKILKGMVEEEGIGGLYRGFIPSAFKNLPNKSW